MRDRGAEGGDDGDDRAGSMRATCAGVRSAATTTPAADGRVGASVEQVAEHVVADGADVVGAGPEVGVGQVVELAATSSTAPSPGLRGRDGVPVDEPSGRAARSSSSRRSRWA